MQAPGGPYIGSVTNGTWFLDNVLSNSHPIGKEENQLNCYKQPTLLVWGFVCPLFLRTFSSCQQLSTLSVWMSNVWRGVSMSFHFYSFFFFSCSSIAKILLFLCRYYILCMYSSGSPSVWRSQIFMIWTQCSVAWSRLKCLSLTSRRLWICVYMNKGRSYYPK